MSLECFVWEFAPQMLSEFAPQDRTAATIPIRSNLVRIERLDRSRSQIGLQIGRNIYKVVIKAQIS